MPTVFFRTTRMQLIVNPQADEQAFLDSCSMEQIECVKAEIAADKQIMSLSETTSIQADSAVTWEGLGPHVLRLATEDNSDKPLPPVMVALASLSASMSSGEATKAVAWLTDRLSTGLTEGPHGSVAAALKSIMALHNLSSASETVRASAASFPGLGVILSAATTFGVTCSRPAELVRLQSVALGRLLFGAGIEIDRAVQERPGGESAEAGRALDPRPLLVCEGCGFSERASVKSGLAFLASGGQQVKCSKCGSTMWERSALAKRQGKQDLQAVDRTKIQRDIIWEHERKRPGRSYGSQNLDADDPPPQALDGGVPQCKDGLHVSFPLDHQPPFPLPSASAFLPSSSLPSRAVMRSANRALCCLALCCLGAVRRRWDSAVATGPGDGLELGV